MITKKVTYIKYYDACRDDNFVSTVKSFNECYDLLNLPKGIKLLATHTFELLEPENYDELKLFPLSDAVKGIVLAQMSAMRGTMTKEGT